MEHFQETLFVIFMYFNLELPCVGILVKKVSWLNGLGLPTGNQLSLKMWILFKLILCIK